MTSLNRQMAKGAAWLVLLRLFDRGLGFLSTLVLARVLMPADFGLIAMAITILAALELLGAFSFDLALIQNQNATRAHYDTAWTFAVLFGVFNALCMCALAHPAALFYGEPRVEGVMYALAACTLLQGFDNVGIIAFQKDLELHKEFMFGLGKKITGFVVTLTLAYYFRSYWALVGGTLAMRVASLVLSYALHPFRPRLSLAAAREMLGFSKWLLLNNLLIFLNNRGTDFVIGRISGARELGLYSVSYELANLPTTELVWPIQRAVFPGYAKLANDCEKLRAAFSSLIGLLAFLTVPIGVGLGLAAQPLVAVLLGDKWMAAVPLIQVLAVFGIVRALHGPTGSVFIAVGKPRVVAFTQCIQIAVALSLMLLLIPRLGTIGAAWSLLAGACCAMLVNYIGVLRRLQLSPADLFAQLWRPLLATAAMGLAMSGLSATLRLLPQPWPALASLAALVGLGACTYLTACLALWWLRGKPSGAESILLGLLAERLRQRKLAV